MYNRTQKQWNQNSRMVKALIPQPQTKPNLSETKVLYGWSHGHGNGETGTYMIVEECGTGQCLCIHPSHITFLTEFPSDVQQMIDDNHKAAIEKETA